MLRRTLLAVFAVHFLLSLCGFTLHLPAPASTESVALAPAGGTLASAAGVADADGLGSSVLHGLTDDASDLPDGAPRGLVAFEVPAATGLDWPGRLRSRDNPTPLGLDRPPQASA